MEIGEARQGEYVILTLVGRLDTKTSHDFEKKVGEILEAGSRRFVVDLAGLEYISSAGLRVLLMLAKKLGGTGGHLSLCSMNRAVRQVFDIAGFTDVFVVAASRAEAMRSSPAEAKSARVAKLAAKMLGVPSQRRVPKADPTTSETAARAARLLGVSEHRPAPASRMPASPDSPEAKRGEKKEG